MENHNRDILCEESSLFSIKGKQKTCETFYIIENGVTGESSLDLWITLKHGMSKYVMFAYAHVWACVYVGVSFLLAIICSSSLP